MGGVLAALARAVRTRRISAEELVRASLERIDRAHELNAVIARRDADALREARRLDAAIARGEQAGLLAGLPLLVKDIEDVAGMRTTFGSLLHADDPPATHDGLVPRRLRAAGAICVGKSNTPEFAFEGYTDNRVFGPTLNPWHRGFSPGGSSGGSGAALAAGLVPIATATDGGGSIRLPAALCGLAGLKPTNGVVGRDPIPDWIDLSTDGPLATSVADLRLLLRVIAGPVAGDPSAQVGWRLRRPALPARVFAARGFEPATRLAPEVERRFDAALATAEVVLQRPVVRLSPLQVLPSAYIPRDWFHNAAPEQLHRLGPERLARAADQLDPAFRRWMEKAARISFASHLESRRRRFRYARELDALLGEDAVLLTPVLTVEGWGPDGRLPDRDEPGLPSELFNTELLNLTGHPGLVLPAGRFDSGVPFGLQIVGPRYREDLLFGLGRRWEETAPWPRVADGYTPFGPPVGV